MDDLFDQHLWKKFKSHANALSKQHLKTVINSRQAVKPLKLGGLEYDYSLNYFDSKVILYLLKYAQSSKIPQFIEQLFSANHINITENRPVLHMALRATPEDHFFYKNKDITSDVYSARNKIAELSHKVRSGLLTGYTGRPIKNIIHIGIGGSELGPKLLTTALKRLQPSSLNIAYLANLDPEELELATKQFNPKETLVFIASKSFTTFETLTNAQFIKSWLGNRQAITKQCYAITENRDDAITFGISKENILPIWSWIGGRYSIWSTVSTVVAIAIGMDNFIQFLEGGRLVDSHVKSDSLVENIPLIMALLDIMYVNVMNYPTRAIIPYSTQMNFFVDYIQQLMMESNGKSLDRRGQPINYKTCPIIWGNIGTNSQHAFHQLLMQGTHQVPIDFIYAKKTASKHQKQHQLFIKQCLAQSRALAFGNTHSENNKVKSVEGNQPQNIIALDEITPYNLGTLVAIYEYRTIFSGILWNINSFDQFGVELGKKLAQEDYSESSF